MRINRRSVLRLTLFTGAAVATFGIASAPLAGGFGIFVSLPEPGNDSRLGDSVLVAKVGGCRGPGSSVVMTAEGLVDGKRVTKRLTPVDVTPRDKLVNIPTFGIRREWPAEGTWLISIVATAAPYLVDEQKNGKPTGKETEIRFTTTALVPIDPEGMPATRATPGGKQERHVNVIHIGSKDREKTIARLLTPSGHKVVRVSGQ